MVGASLLAENETTITSGVSTVTELVGSVWTLMTSNPLVMVFVGASLLGVAVGIIRKLTKGRA